MDLPLPADTRINVRYGGNPEGEPYGLGETRTPQAVSCSEDVGGAPSVDDAARGGEGGAAGASPSAALPATEGSAVLALRCGLYTQGPARLDVTATGYEPIEDQALAFERKKRCEVPIEVKLVPLKPDAGM
jgi:hypothetical protein